MRGATDAACAFCYSSLYTEGPTAEAYLLSGNVLERSLPYHLKF